MFNHLVRIEIGRHFSPTSTDMRRYAFGLEFNDSKKKLNCGPSVSSSFIKEYWSDSKSLWYLVQSAWFGGKTQDKSIKKKLASFLDNHIKIRISDCHSSVSHGFDIYQYPVLFSSTLRSRYITYPS